MLKKALHFRPFNLLFLMVCLCFSSTLKPIENNRQKVAYIIDWPGSTDQCVENQWHNDQRCAVDTLCMKQALKKHGFSLELQTSLSNMRNPDIIICCDTHVEDVHLLANYPHATHILYIREPPTTMPQNFMPQYNKYFDFICTWHDGFVDNKKYFKFYYPVAWPMIPDLIDFNQKKLCTLVAGNKGFPHPDELYSERKRAIEFFERSHPENFDFYGLGWENSHYKHYKTYGGEIAPGHKLDYLQRYKFCICYENTKNVPGYITEKIFDCFQAGCIPIYCGAPNIERYIPKNCFISFTDFNNYEALYNFILSMPETTYKTYIYNIKAFLENDQATLYTQQHCQKLCDDLIKRAVHSNELHKKIKMEL